MMEQLFKERKEKLHLFKSLRKKRENVSQPGYRAADRRTVSSVGIS